MSDKSSATVKPFMSSSTHLMAGSLDDGGLFGVSRTRAFLFCLSHTKYFTETVEETLPKSAVLTSPNFPNPYDRDTCSIETIQVTKGKTIKLHFTDFSTQPYRDHVIIRDGNSTLLSVPGSYGEPEGYLSGCVGKDVFSCNRPSLPDDIFSFTETVHVKFETDDAKQVSGWRLEWSEV